MPFLLLTLLKAATAAFLTKIIGAAVTERILAELFFYIATWLAKKSTNALDDTLVEQVRTAYYGAEPTQQH